MLECSVNNSDKIPFWYKESVLYVVYPDAFTGKSKFGFDNLTDHLPVLKKMGIGAVHVLPFLESPMLDAGFDVSDYTAVSVTLGGNQALDKFLQSAKQHNLRIFMDLVVNHISIEHEWYCKAMQGSEKHRNYFIHSTKKPVLLGIESDKTGKWAKYKLGRRVLRSRIIFLENGDELLHWTHGDDGNWYYHTFYPHQIDLNWTNPDVYKEFAEIIKYWASKGMNFRIDAAPFVGKSLTGIMKESSSESHIVVKKLHAIAKEIDPECTFLLEACQPIQKVKKYFGSDLEPESELAYNFPLMHAMWAAIMAQDNKYIWDALKKTQTIPAGAQWVTFLRNHDELSLEYASDKVRNVVYASLVDKSLAFRGEYGVAGRTASFLKNNLKRILMSHLLLASLNGSPAIVYGDEYGKVTNKRLIKIDTRDSNRGVLTEKAQESHKAKRILEGITSIFAARSSYSWIATAKPTRLRVSKGIFGVCYSNSTEVLYIYINLNSKFKKQSIKIANSKVVLTVNGSKISNNIVSLPAYSGIWLSEKL